MLFRYDRGRVRAGPFSLKEWDFYQILSGGHVVQLSIGHVSYAASFSATVFSLATGERWSLARIRPLPLRSLAMPASPDAPCRLGVELEGFMMRFDYSGGRRHLILRAADRRLGRAEIEVELEDREEDRMAIATPFDRPRLFYLNEKRHFYGVAGRLRLGDLRLGDLSPRDRARRDLSLDFSPGDCAVLDWGRGVWPYRHEWFWGNGAAFVEGGRLGFNLGWGFGKAGAATENMLFWNGRARKLGPLAVERDEGDYLAPWRFRDATGCLDLEMRPLFDNFTRSDLVVASTRCHQVFGRFSGTVALPDGRPLALRDFLAFCERAVNRW